MQSLRPNWRGAHPVFLLIIDWNGTKYYLSSKPISLASTGQERTFIGGLEEDPQMLFDLGDMDFSIDAFSTPISCIIQNVDISKEVMGGNTLQDSDCELSYVLEKTNSIQSYDDRVILLNGLLKQPVFGHNDRPSGYLEFSIEAPTFFGSLYAFQTKSTARLTPNDISSLTNTTLSPFSSKFIGSSTLVDVPDAHRGKALPIVLGIAGTITDQSASTKRYGATPAYCVAVETTSLNTVWIAIAAHYVQASQCRIFDQDGNNLLTNVLHYIRADDSVFAYVTFDLKSSPTSNVLRNIVEDSGAEYYASFHPSTGGGLLSRATNKAIEGGGDICLQFLQLGNAKVDYTEWACLSPILNNYKFAGYINSADISPLEYLENEIIPFLPISVIYGENGLKPVLNMLYEGIQIYVKHKITADQEFYQSGAIQTLTNSESIINYFTLNYAYALDQNKYMSTMRITPDINFNSNTQFSTIYSALSSQRYGIKKEEIESKYVHDESTAALICRDKVRFHGVALRSIEYTASPRYGYIDVGDIIELTDSNLFTRPKIAQVIQKQWKDTNWTIIVKVEDHLQSEL